MILRLIYILLALIPTVAGAAGYGLVKIPVAPLREKPAHSAEMGTQAMMGTPVALDSVADGEWWELTMPCGYHGYIHTSSICVLDDEEYRVWTENHARMMSVVHLARLTDTAGRCPRGYVPYGGVVERRDSLPGGRWLVALPDGTEAVALAADFEPLDRVAQRMPHAQELLQAVEFALEMQGAPYLWGGTTPLAPDCSGLTQMCMLRAGILLPRNASQQVSMGTSVASLAEARAGDLLFFANPAGRIEHVAIYMGDHRLVHSSGSVYVASMDGSDPTLPSYGRKPVAIRRMTVDTVPMLKDCALYFNHSD